MKFTKMHGCGNDYIYVNGEKEVISKEKKPDLVRRLSDRHFGIGGDGVIFIYASTEADFEMEMYNMDGSRAEMCGNGIRCVGKYVYDKGLTDKTDISIMSCGKRKYLHLTVTDKKVSAVRVNMGSPILQAEKIPVLLADGGSYLEKEMFLEALDTAKALRPKGAVIAQDIEVQGKHYEMTCVSMGNPHAVIFVEDVFSLPLEKLGPLFEHHERFPKKVNTEFIHVTDESHMEMRVWERGTGETLACGTGACAAAVAGVLNGLTKERVAVKLLGGSLFIQWDREKNLVYMTGPAETVFEGEVEI